jgi:hypothetical protein
MDSFDELSINLQISAMGRIIGIFLKFNKEWSSALSYSLCKADVQSSKRLLQSNLSSITEAYEFNLTIRVGGFRYRCPIDNMLILLSLFPDISDSSHITIDVEGQQVLIVVKTVNFFYTFHQVREVKAKRIAYII